VLTDAPRFADPPTIVDPDIPGAIVMPNPASAPLSDNREGVIWVGVQRTYDVYPRGAGQLVVPPPAASARLPDGRRLEARGAALTATIGWPAALAGRDAVVIAAKLTVAETITPVDGDIAVGAAIERGITVTAEDTTAMLLPDPPWPDPAGFSLYRAAPVLEDRGNRGQVVAIRRDAATLVASAPGTIVLPAVAIAWWNPRTATLHQADLPAHRLTVAVMAGAEPGGRAWLPIGLGLVALLGLGVAGGLIARHPRWRTALARWRDREPARYRRLRDACRRGDPQAARHALAAWLAARPDARGGVATAEGVLARHLFGPSAATAWSGADLAAAARAARRAKPAPRRAAARLAPLNPIGDGG
jgi:hypothetical protein